MKIFFMFIAAAALCCGSAFAEIKSCDELRSAIDAGLQAKGISGYTLDIVPRGQATGKKVVGTCEGGSKKIIYSHKKRK